MSIFKTFVPWAGNMYLVAYQIVWGPFKWAAGRDERFKMIIHETDALYVHFFCFRFSSWISFGLQEEVFVAPIQSYHKFDLKFC